MKINKYKLKREILPFVIFYIISEIFIVSNIVVSLHDAGQDADLVKKITSIFTNFVSNITSFKFLGAIFVDFFGFLNISFWALIIVAILFIAWKIKNSNNSEYDGIENGSSDWAKDGEEFDKLPDGREVLNKKQGFILSKDHRLGTDLKQVLINKNILVVGRIRCW